MKPTTRQIEIIENHGVSAFTDNATEITTLAFTTKHGGEESADVPFAEDFAEAVRRVFDEYDADEEAYLWLDNTGHGKNGAPHRMADVLADKEEWRAKLGEIADALDNQKIRGEHFAGSDLYAAANTILEAIDSGANEEFKHVFKDEVEELRRALIYYNCHGYKSM